MEAEDVNRMVWVGKSGYWLRRTVRGMGIPSGDVSYGHVVSCRVTHKKGIPKQWEVDACDPVLNLQVSAINPRVIILLGATALRKWRPDWVFEEKVGWLFQDRGRLLVAAPHPATCVKNNEEAVDNEKQFRQIIKRVRRRARGDNLLDPCGDWPGVCSVCGAEDVAVYDEMGVPYGEKCRDLVGREKGTGKQLVMV